MPTFHLKIKSGSNSSGHYDYVIRDKERKTSSRRLEFWGEFPLFYLYPKLPYFHSKHFFWNKTDVCMF
jgi:hypothetical protein